jgi:5-methylcytosine-specific restriction endonuclease McrA
MVVVAGVSKEMIVKVLLLNRSEAIVSLIEWQRAVCLYVTGKAVKPHGHEDYYDIKMVSGIFQLPTALVLVTYVKIPYRRVAVSKENVLKRDSYECQYCGKRLTNATGTIDHVLPTSRGGKHAWANVVAACRPCNNQKDNKTPDEAGLKLRCRPFVPTSDIIVMTAVDVRTRQTWTRWIMS